MSFFSWYSQYSLAFPRRIFPPSRDMTVPFYSLSKPSSLRMTVQLQPQLLSTIELLLLRDSWRMRSSGRESLRESLRRWTRWDHFCHFSDWKNASSSSSLFQNNVRRSRKEKVTAFDEAIITEVFRQMTANEAAWILSAFPLVGHSHAVSFSMFVHPLFARNNWKSHLIIPGEATLCSLPQWTVSVLRGRTRREYTGGCRWWKEEVCIPSLHGLQQGE